MHRTKEAIREAGILYHYEQFFERLKRGGEREVTLLPLLV